MDERNPLPYSMSGYNSSALSQNSVEFEIALKSANTLASYSCMVEENLLGLGLLGGNRQVYAVRGQGHSHVPLRIGATLAYLLFVVFVTVVVTGLSDSELSGMCV
jgi:hypothetical protein